MVRSRASFSEVGTLELGCEARDAPQRGRRLQFELRGRRGHKLQQLDGTVNHEPGANAFTHRRLRLPMEPSRPLCNSSAMFLATLLKVIRSRPRLLQVKWKRRSARRETHGPSPLFAGSARCSSRLPPDARNLRAMRCVGSIYPACACGRGSVHQGIMRSLTICGESCRRRTRFKGTISAMSGSNQPLVLLRRISGGIHCQRAAGTLSQVYESCRSQEERPASTSNSSTREWRLVAGRLA